MLDYENRRGVKIYDSRTKKIFFNASRDLITVDETYMTCFMMPIMYTWYSSTANIKFRERENMLFEIKDCTYPTEIIDYLFASYGMQDYKIIEKLEDYRKVKCIEFKSDTDYACFKLRFYTQIVDARLKKDAR